MTHLTEPNEPNTLTPRQDILLEGSWAREHRRRMVFIQDVYGFAPHNAAEAGIVVGVRNHEMHHVPFPMLTYLQKEYDRHDTHGKQAIEKVVETMTETAGNALDETGYALKVMDTLQGYTLDETGMFSDIYPVSDWQNDPDAMAHLTALARRAEMEVFMNGAGADVLTKKHSIDSTKGEERVERIRASLSTLTTLEVMELVQRLCQAEDARFDYWYTALQDAASHFFARGQAAEALREFAPYKAAIDARASIKAHGML